jgi:teichoic acid transport system ATP-binding protein
MINEMAIEAKNITKIYKTYDRPHHRLVELLGIKEKYKEYTALNDVSFSIEKGRTVGIIGPNGSGKSTILQIITGILQPTQGKVAVSGRISALLELGAGFNPEFTGRENVYLYASILGMDKTELESRLPDIIKFASIGDFIDKPVKTYSSGMYVRLAFSVAINVDPEILIVDEALAVGDEAFQRKCFRKFEELKEKGVTILFVTHSLGLVKSFCDEAILIYKGKLIEKGNPNYVINVYTKLVAENEEQTNGNQDDKEANLPDINDKENINMDSEELELGEFRYGNGKGKITSFSIYGENGNTSRIFSHSEKIIIEVEVEYNKYTSTSLIAYTIKTITGIEVTGTNTMFENIDLKERKPGDKIKVIFTQETALNAGDYVFSFGFVEMEEDKLIVLDRRYDAITFKVVETKKSAGLVDPKVSIKTFLHEGVEQK